MSNLQISHTVLPDGRRLNYTANNVHPESFFELDVHGNRVFTGREYKGESNLLPLDLKYAEPLPSSAYHRIYS